MIIIIIVDAYILLESLLPRGRISPNTMRVSRESVCVCERVKT